MDQSIVGFGLLISHNNKTFIIITLCLLWKQLLHNAWWEKLAIFDDNSLSRLHIKTEQRGAVSSGVFKAKLETSLWNALLESCWRHIVFVVIISQSCDILD